MAFGVTKHQLEEWKQAVQAGEIVFLTHYWRDDRFPTCTTVTKVGCSDLVKLAAWGEQYGLKKEWIDNRKSHLPHFDLFGHLQRMILQQEGIVEPLLNK